MIHYALQCARQHSFDGWFKDSASFEQQAAQGLIVCPICNTTAVSRALMAPALARSAKHAAERPAAERRVDDRAAAAEPGLPSGRSSPTAPAAPPVTGHTIPDEIRAVLQRVRAEVEKHCDYVGQDFAEEARRIHYGEAEARGIYGETTRDEAEALSDEGIEFGVMPWLPRPDS
ncbi:DUF1178 family protein [Acidisoma sp. C75]